MGWVGLWGFLWWAPSAKRKDHRRVSSGWSSTWFHSNTGLYSTRYEQIPIIFGVWPFWLTPFFFSVNNILAGLWLNCISSVEIILFLLADILLQQRVLFQCYGLVSEVIADSLCKLIQSLFLQWFVNLAGALTFLFLLWYIFLKVDCVLSMWEKIMSPVYRLLLHGLYGLYGPRCPLSDVNFNHSLTHSLTHCQATSYYLKQCWPRSRWHMASLGLKGSSAVASATSSVWPVSQLFEAQND